MCTAITYQPRELYMGRSLDYEASYGEEIVMLPRRFPLRFRHGGGSRQGYAILGTAHVADGYPLYYDAVNEKRPRHCRAELRRQRPLCRAAGRAAERGAVRIHSVAAAAVRHAGGGPAAAAGRQPDGNAVQPALPPPPSCTGCSRTRPAPSRWSRLLRGCRSENPVGVLTNNPPFPQQLFALNNYMHLSPRQPENTFAPDVPLQAYSRGMGALGLPGDLSSGSRFVRAAFTKLHSVCSEARPTASGSFFHIMETVSQTRGCCEVAPENLSARSTPRAGMPRAASITTTYGNRRITAVDLHREPLDGTALRRYPMLTAEDILVQNGGAGA